VIGIFLDDFQYHTSPVMKHYLFIISLQLNSIDSICENLRNLREIKILVPADSADNRR